LGFFGESTRIGGSSTIQVHPREGIEGGWYPWKVNLEGGNRRDRPNSERFIVVAGILSLLRRVE